MKIRGARRGRRRESRAAGGFSLIECLVYISVLAVILGLGYSALYRTYTNSENLRRNIHDIERTLQAGERWRADVRAATGTPDIIANGLRIPQRSGVVSYVFEGGTVWRLTGPTRTPVLKAVKDSRMLMDRREHLVSWRWDLELASPQKVVRVRPLFTFQAVCTRP